MGMPPPKHTTFLNQFKTSGFQKPFEVDIEDKMSRGFRLQDKSDVPKEEAAQRMNQLKTGEKLYEDGFLSGFGNGLFEGSFQQGGMREKDGPVDSADEDNDRRHITLNW